MYAVPFLICFPLLVALILAFVGKGKVGNAVTIGGAGVIMLASVGFFVYCAMEDFESMELFYETPLADHLILLGEILLMILVIVKCIIHKKYWISLLSIIPTAMIAYVELTGEHEEIAHIYVDRLSALMCLIVGIIGSLIIIYAVGYMDGYHAHHKEIEDRRYYFFLLLFVFMGAMYGFVLSSSLIWLDFFWELTSVCSFMLIGYTKLEEAITNSFRALWMNLFGGLALAIGIVYYYYTVGNLSFREFIEEGIDGNPFSVIPITLMAFAALTKAAQLPFSPWLLGAMVAPTPSSALLHSATMVKAGVYVLIRLSPAFQDATTETLTMTGTMISVIGGFTFCVASIMAIAQADAKRVLALSTVSNLGLMVACAGVGTPETIWACIFLMIFHAVSKALLFLDVGATENSLFSRDIENMHGLINILPRLATFMFIGIAGMFLAPFGMLISKWSALRAMVDEKNMMTLIFIVFGSATTSFYWSKWMGKIIAHVNVETIKPVRDVTKKSELFALWIQAVMMILLCIMFPLLSKVYVDPLLDDMFSSAGEVLPMSILYMLVVIITFVFAIPLITSAYSEHMASNTKMSYMGGINTGTNHNFVDSFGESKKLFLANYYFATRIGVRKLMLPSQVLTSAILLLMGCIIFGGAL
ncbi:NADH-quinone oxidoreductase subunit L [Lachnospiraceae bacterium C1.1]|nr:proton-conducting transporter membrane subunit [Lachnospiraceae bacterium C1.1]